MMTTKPDTILPLEEQHKVALSMIKALRQRSAEVLTENGMLSKQIGEMTGLITIWSTKATLWETECKNRMGAYHKVHTKWIKSGFATAAFYDFCAELETEWDEISIFPKEADVPSSSTVKENPK